MDYKVFFSAASMLPAIGGVFGSSLSLPLVAVYFLIKKSIGFSFVAGGLPTLCATMNWSVSNKIMRMLFQLMLPVLCMTLFILHPVGGQAFAYSLYWLVPMAIFLVSRYVQSIFLVALSSTFIAHAVGSVIFLYTVPTTPEQWLSLIPVVAMERLMFAVGGTVIYAALSSLKAGLLQRRSS